MRHAYQLKINFTGGIVSPGILFDLLQVLQKSGLKNVRFGMRQQLLIDVQPRQIDKVRAALLEAGIEYEMNGDHYPNISSSYPAASIFIKEGWLAESVYKDVFDLFDYRPSIKINIVDRCQTFTPFFTGNLNWIASANTHFWYLVIRFPKTNLIYYWKDLVYTNDLGRVSARIEREFADEPAAYRGNANASGDHLYAKIIACENYMTKPVNDKLVLPPFKLPYYEGYNEIGNKSWLGIYRRDENFAIDFLKDVCRICLEAKLGELYTTPWKSIIVKGIEERCRPLWGFVLGKYRINVRHAYNELNWQVEDGSSEGLAIKKAVIRQFDKEDVRSYGLCFAVKTQERSSVFGSVLVRRQFAEFRNKITPLDKYDILYTSDFNPNSKNYILFRGNVSKTHIGTYLIAICKYYYEQEDLRDLLPGSSYPEPRFPGRQETTMKIHHQCPNCLTLYDELYGDPENGIEAGVEFASLPDSYTCALCETPKADFLIREEDEQLEPL